MSLLSILALLVGPRGLAATRGLPELPWAAAANASSTALATLLECVDSQPGCTGWAAGGECTNNPGFMHSTCRLSCSRCALSGEDATKAVEVCRFAARHLLGLHNSLLGVDAADAAPGLERSQLSELMVEALSLLETCGERHTSVNDALKAVADAIAASVDSTCGRITGTAARPECAPPPSEAALARAAAAASALSAPARDGASDSVMLRGADGTPSVRMPLVGECNTKLRCFTYRLCLPIR